MVCLNYSNPKYSIIILPSCKPSIYFGKLPSSVGYNISLEEGYQASKPGRIDCPEGRLRGEGGSLTQDQLQHLPGWYWVNRALWSPTDQTFMEHQLAHVDNFWRQGRPAVFHFESLSNGQASLSLKFLLPHPSEIIPPPLPNKLPTPIPSRRPIIPLFPVGKAPTVPPSSRQRKSYRCLVLHWASKSAANHSPPPPPGTLRAQCAKVLQKSATQPTTKRPRPSSSSSSSSSPLNFTHRMQEDFGL